MASKPKGNRTTGSQATSAQTAETREASAGNAARDEDIRRRAYEIYLERGQQRGRELDDWLQAERELERGALDRRGRSDFWTPEEEAHGEAASMDLRS